MSIKRTAIPCLLAVCALLPFSGNSVAEIFYKWTDETGTIHYGERPSPDYESTPIKASSSFAKEDSNEIDPNETKEEAAKREEAEQYCDIAKENLSVLSSDDTIQQRDEYGNLHELSEEQLAGERQRAQAAVEQYCKE